MMALATITTFYQVDTNHWLAEIEIGGLVCKRREVRERTLPEALSAILESYRAMATPEMLEAQGMAGPVVDPGHDNGIGRDLGGGPSPAYLAKQEQMARVRAAKAAKRAAIKHSEGII